MTNENHKISGGEKANSADLAKMMIGLVVLVSMGNVRIQAATYEMSTEQELFGYLWILISSLVGLVTMKVKTLLLTTLVSPLLSIYRHRVKNDAYSCASFSAISCIWSFFVASSILCIIIAMDFTIVKHHLFSGSNPLY
jgi:hypothetical protein